MKTFIQKHRKEYNAWFNMRERCYDVTHKYYARYGGRGIKICNRWKNSFPNFLSDIGVAPSLDMTLERINNNKGYNPKNCKWATWKEQMSNRDIEGIRINMREQKNFLGHKHSKKSKAKISKSLTGKIRPQEVKDKISKSVSKYYKLQRYA